MPRNVHARLLDSVTWWCWLYCT